MFRPQSKFGFSNTTFTLFPNTTFLFKVEGLKENVTSSESSDSQDNFKIKGSVSEVGESIWATLERIPPESIFEVMKNFMLDRDPRKVNAGIGVIPDENGGPFVFNEVQEAFKNIDPGNFGYQLPQGDPKFLQEMEKLFLGEKVNLNETALQATVGGTHANRLFAELLIKQNPEAQRGIIVGEPTWDNHIPLFARAGEIKQISHLQESGQVDFDSYLGAVEKGKLGDVLIVQGGITHNPTGQNLSLEQLDQIIEILNKKEMILFVDFAYLGLGASLEEDSKFAQLALEKANTLGMAMSASKAFTIYNKRTAALLVKARDKQEKVLLEENLARLNRDTVTNVPADGETIVADILGDPEKRKRWEQELKVVRERIIWDREQLVEKVPEIFGHLSKGQGLFGILDLTKKQILEDLTKKHIYMPDNGRFNFASINEGNLDYVVEQFKSLEH